MAEENFNRRLSIDSGSAHEGMRSKRLSHHPRENTGIGVAKEDALASSWKKTKELLTKK